MGMKLYNEDDIQMIADAIREKNGKTDKYKVADMPQAILDIEGTGFSKEYQEVEYIESTGTQYIDTGFKPNQNSGIDIKIEAKENLNAYYPIPYGSREGSVNRFMVLMQFPIPPSPYDNETWVPWYGNKSKTLTTSSASRYGEQQIIVNKNIYIQNGNVFIMDNQTFSCAYNMYLFAVNNTNNASQYFYGKIYYCKIFNNGLLIRDYVPCYRKLDGEIGMYDKVSKQFFTNQGTGIFLKGADI